MPKGLLFWVIMVLWLFLGGVAYWPKDSSWGAIGPFGGNLLLFILLFLLGWAVFGFVVQ